MKKINAKQSKNDYPESDEFFFYSLELESQWKKSLPKPTDKELVEFFKPNKEMLLENISKLKKEYRKVKNEIKKDLENVPEKNQEILDIFFEKFRIPRLTKIENRIFQLKRQLAIVSPSTKKSFSRYENFQEMIQIAKSKSIIEVARDKLELRQTGKNFIARCCFHEDKSPSLTFFPETNTFVCFGCGEKGDVIKFNQLINGASFAEAVKMLQ